jgi:hypothetical protein
LHHTANAGNVISEDQQGKHIIPSYFDFLYTVSMKKLLTIVALLLSSYGFSQRSDDFGFADKTIPELAEFEYYCGVWHTKMEMKQEDGSFKALDTDATVKGYFLDDHKTFQSQFTTPTGFFSTDIGTFDVNTKEWRMLFLNANAQRWHEFTAKMEEGKMITLVIGGYSGKEAFNVKTIDTVISETHYQRNVYQSTDDGKTWVLVYKMYAHREA